MRKKHLFTSFALITALSVQMLAPTMGQPALAATKMKLNKTSASINVGKKVTLKVIGCKKSVSWKTSNKIVATVKKSGKNSAVVTGKNIGTAKVTAKVKGKKFTCTVKVSKKKYTGLRLLCSQVPFFRGGHLQLQIQRDQLQVETPAQHRIQIQLLHQVE